MEAMGQMGNSEGCYEETYDLPFDMYDLDVEDAWIRNATRYGARPTRQLCYWLYCNTTWVEVSL